VEFFYSRILFIAYNGTPSLTYPKLDKRKEVLCALHKDDFG
jgi:hypothetical protein